MQESNVCISETTMIHTIFWMISFCCFVSFASSHSSTTTKKHLCGWGYAASVDKSDYTHFNFRDEYYHFASENEIIKTKALLAFYLIREKRLHTLTIAFCWNFWSFWYQYVQSWNIFLAGQRHLIQIHWSSTQFGV